MKCIKIFAAKHNKDTFRNYCTFLIKPVTQCLLVLSLEGVPDSDDWKGHLWPSGPGVHRALAEECIGLRFSLDGWYPVHTSMITPSACCSQASPMIYFQTASDSHVSFVLLLLLSPELHADAWFIIHNSPLFAIVWQRIKILPYHSRPACV